MQTLLGMEKSDLQALLPGQPAFRARQLYEAIYHGRVTSLSAVSTLPKDVRERLEAECSIGHLTQATRYQSADGTRRYLLSLSDGKSVEAVFMPEENRDTLCISTQVGCPVDCKFCLTALIGLERNLTAGEIVGQVLHLAQDNNLWSDQKRINIVMMGQGEPLLNLSNVLKATRLLCDPRGLNIAPRRITVSTSGIITKMAELARAEIRPRLAISLNGSNQDQRSALMPITRKHTLEALIEACRTYPLRPWEKLTFEYVLLKDVNDSEADARRVVRLLSNLNCKVNLIALNPGPGIPFETPDPEKVTAFQEILKRSFPCFIRRPRGLDIFAACGQLKRMESAGSALVQL
jgi:23S rRNA (adenine2503-C2)-methyltransferase